ncbi:MAG: hypothetical protein A2Y65_01125, partial [Deltaproteobacteria bacterium RBG_13_52_11]
MKDNDETQKQLIKELSKLRHRIAELEASGRKRNQFEVTLRTERDKAQQYLDIAEVMLVVLDKKGNIALINRKGNQILGYKEGELLGKNWFTTCLPAHVRKGVKGVFRKLVAGEGEITEFYENPVLTKSGTERMIAWHNTLLKNAQEKNIGTLSSGMDITERRQAEEKLRESESRFRTLFEAIPDTVLVHDDEGTILHINEIGAQQLEWSGKNLVGRNLREIVTPENRASIADHVRETHKVGWNRFETTYVSRSGWKIMAEVNEHPIMFGKEKAILSVARDITKRKEAEDALLKEKKFSDSVMNSSPGLLFIFGDKGNIIQWNRNVENVTGYSASEIAKMNVLDFVAKEDKNIAAEAVQEALTLGQASLEIDVLTKPGKEIPFYITGRRTKIENAICLVCTGIDITERKRAEEALRETERQLHTLVDNFPDFIARFDKECRHLYVNPAVTRAFGVPLEHFIGKTLHELAAIGPPGQNEALHAAIKQVFKQGLPNTFEALWPTERGYRVFEVRHIPELDEHGRVVSVLGVTRDITERKRAEEALRESEATLRALINAPTDSVILLDSRGVILELNKIAAERLGKSRAELIGTLTDDSLPEDIAKRRRSIISQVFETSREVRFEDERDGIWYDTVVHPITDKDGMISRLAIIARDITKRKRAEEALQSAYVKLKESETRYRTLVENIDLGINLIDANHTILMASAAEGRQINKPLNDLIGKKCFREFEKRDAVCPHCPGVRAMATGQPAEAETEGVRDDGSRYNVRVQAFPVFGDDGTVTGFIEIAENITERKRAEKELRESEERYRSLFENSEDAILLTAPDGSIFKANPAACRMFGCTEAEITQMGRNGVVDQTDPRLPLALEERKRTGRFRGELTLVRSDGQPFPAEVTSVVFQSQDGQPRSSMLIRDITERKRAEEALRESEERFRTVFESAEDIIFIKDRDHRFTFVNPAMARDHGVPASKLIGKTSKDLFGEERSVKIIEDDLRVLRGEIINKEQPSPLKGSLAVHHLIKVPIHNSTGEIIGLCGIARDITERKQAEEKLRESEERFRTVFESAEDKIYIKDRNLRFTFVNPAQARIHGTTPSKLIGKTSKDLFGEERSAKIMEDDLRVLRGEIVDKEELSPIKGSSDIIHIIKVPLHNSAGEIVGLCGIARDITDRKQAEVELRRSYQQMREMLVTTINALASTVEMKDQYTAGHQPRATQLACAIAEEMGLSEEQIEGIHMAGSVHDIGKIIVPAEILNKPGPLTEIQYEMVKMHPRAGFDVLKGIKFPWPVAQIVLQHHELMDGSGYPQGLSGDEIMLEARILTVANVVEAMNAHRP